MSILYKRRHEFGINIAKINFILVCISIVIFAIMPPLDLDRIVSQIVIMSIVVALPVWLFFRNYRKIYFTDLQLERHEIKEYKEFSEEYWTKISLGKMSNVTLSTNKKRK